MAILMIYLIMLFIKKSLFVQLKNKNIEDAITSINKDILKLEKKKDSSKNEIDKHILAIKILLMKDIVSRFNIDNKQSKK